MRRLTIWRPIKDPANYFSDVYSCFILLPGDMTIAVAKDGTTRRYLANASWSEQNFAESPGWERVYP